MTHPVPFLVRLPIVIAAMFFVTVAFVALTAPRTELQELATLNAVPD